MSNINNGEFSKFIESLKLKTNYNNIKKTIMYTKNGTDFTYDKLKQNIAIKKAFYLYKFKILLSFLINIDDSLKKDLIEKFEKYPSPDEAFLLSQYTNAKYMNNAGSNNNNSVELNRRAKPAGRATSASARPSALSLF